MHLPAQVGKNSLKSYSRVLVNSFYSRESVLRAYGVESYVNYLGIDSGRFTNCQSPGGKRNFCVGLGTVYHAKGIDRAIQVISRIPANIRPSIEWIGNGAWKHDLASYEKLALELGVDIKFFLNASHELVLEKLSQAKFMIYTSRLEPFGYAPLEAMASKTPVAALPEGGVRETVIDGTNGILSNDGSYESLAEKLTKHYEDDSFEDLGIAAFKSVAEKWSIQNSVLELEKHLSAIVR